MICVCWLSIIMSETILLSLHWCLSAGVIPTDHEDEAQRPEETADGEVSWRGRPGLRGSGEVSCTFTPTGAESKMRPNADDELLADSHEQNMCAIYFMHSYAHKKYAVILSNAYFHSVYFL